MTRNTRSTDSIDRRTTLGLLTGGLASLAGCIGGSSGPSNESESGSDSGGLLSGGNSGWVPPEEQSDYITDSEFIANQAGDPVSLDLQLQNSEEILGLHLVDAEGNRWDDGGLRRGNFQVPLTDRDFDETQATAITSGENTLVIELGVDEQERLPLRLGTSLEVQGVTTDISGEDPDDRPLGIIVENTGPHATSASSIAFSNVPEYLITDRGSTGEIKYEYDIIQSGETKPVRVPDNLWRTNRCDEVEQREVSFTIRSLWADNVSVSRTVEYPNSTDAVRCGSLVESPTTSG